MRTIKRVTVNSAFKVGMVVGGIGFLVFYIPFALLQGALVGSLSSISGNSYYNSGASSGILGGGFAAIACVWIVGTVVAAIAGGIGAALYAFIYNISYGMHGGIQAEVE